MDLKYLSLLLGHGVFLLSIQENMNDGPHSGKVDLIDDHECDDNDRHADHDKFDLILLICSLFLCPLGPGQKLEISSRSSHTCRLNLTVKK